MVFEPDGIEVERWAEVKYVRVFALQKMWNTQFRPVMKNRILIVQNKLCCNLKAVTLKKSSFYSRQVRSPEIDAQHKVDFLHWSLQSSC